MIDGWLVVRCSKEAKRRKGCEPGMSDDVSNEIRKDMGVSNVEAEAGGLAKYRKYVERALAMPGVVDALLITADQVVFDGRTYLKCMYGCTGWNNSWVCPSAPGALKPWEAEPLLRKYKAILLIHTHDKESSHKASLAIESEAFVDGYYFAFSLSDCSLCRNGCTYPGGEPCRFPQKARPAAQGMGIDVFATARGLGLPIKTLASASEEEQNWYSFVFIE